MLYFCSFRSFWGEIPPPQGWKENARGVGGKWDEWGRGWRLRAIVPGRFQMPTASNLFDSHEGSWAVAWQRDQLDLVGEQLLLMGVVDFKASSSAACTTRKRSD